jgi:hypothetical protein
MSGSRGGAGGAGGAELELDAVVVVAAVVVVPAGEEAAGTGEGCGTQLAPTSAH